MKNGISLYTGAGGLDIGFRAAGFGFGIAVERDRRAVETLLANPAWHEGTEILPLDIASAEAAPGRLEREYGLKPGDVDLLIGGPPCQPFSKSAYWATGDSKRLDDPRTDTLSYYLQVVRHFQPKAFLMENVKGFTFQKKDEALKLFEHTIEEINREVGTAYKLSTRVLNAANYGVPQKRERFFIIAGREGQQFDFPEASHAEQGPAELFERPLHPWISAWDAIGHLPYEPSEAHKVTGKWAALLPSIPEGENYLYHTPRGGGKSLFGWRTRYWMFLLKLAKRLPSWTITARYGGGTGPFHWSNRQLSEREVARLQTFPDDYAIVGSYADVRRQLGNAVPALLAETLANSMKEQLFGHPATPRTLEIRSLGSPPPGEIPGSVPPEYDALEDDDRAAHPGAGRGPLYSQ